MNDSCIFCKIVSGEVPSQKVYEDEDILAFHDIHGVAPVHILFIPKKHISSLAEVTSSDEKLVGNIFLRIKEVAASLGLEKTGFRVVNNMGNDGGQTVYHIHFHVLGGRSLAWPPG